MDMSGMSTSSMGSLVMTSSAVAAAPTSSPGMNMGGGMGPNACKISMLWNWYTIDACFIARSWHVRSSGAFAGSCIGVILLVIALELLRRSQREFDRYLRLPHARNGSETGSGNDTPRTAKNSQIKVAGLGLSSWAATTNTRALKLWQHAVRSLLYTVQFAVGYFIMLLAMYYNGYIIICILIGAFLGAMIFQWDTFDKPFGPEQKDSCCN